MEMCYLTRNPLYSKKKVRLLQKKLTWELFQVLNLRTGRRLRLQHVTVYIHYHFLIFALHIQHDS